ncbi:MAG: filamentous hemagglutinin N-terminal domain-containing protein [Cyanobacteria bacterium J06633_8]
MKDRFYKCLQLGLVGISSYLSVFYITSKALAQQSNIIPDNTLGAESSRLNRNVPINGINADSIDGGALRDSNLFHSFREFNINDGKAAYFVNPSGVENIFTRVTGGNPSNILGTLGVDGAANLFLINPSGIVFGQNASLDIQGSFLGTTASGIQFGEQGSFSATNPEIPGSLTVNPSALFFNQVEASGGIINKSQAPAGINPNGGETTGLRVPDGKSLLLVGGDINLDGGRLRAYEGNIELASVTSPGSVGLNIAGNSFNLNLPEDVERGDISLANESYLSVFGAGAGNFTINARNLEISNSFIFAGIAENSDNSNAQGGDVNLNATGLIELKGDSGIYNNVYSQGNAGDININANSLSLTTGSQIYSDIYGIGNAGNININARESISLQGTINLDWFTDNNYDIEDIKYTTISSAVFPEYIGNAGNIKLTTGTLSLSDNASIYTDTMGKGNAGNITINARDAVTLDNYSEVSSLVSTGGVGKGGNIHVITKNLTLTNGSQLSTRVLGEGNAGNIFVEASDSVKLDGFFGTNIADYSIDNALDEIFVASSIESSLLNFGIGRGGDIQINTGNLFVSNYAKISSATNGQGNAGNITINARDKVTFSELGHAESSAINISQFFDDNSTFTVENAGDIRIKTGELLLKDGGFISASNDGGQNAGNIFLDVRDTITFDGIASNGIQSNASTTGYNGNAGNIEVKTGSLFLTNGGYMSTALVVEGSTDKVESAGDIKINVRDTVNIDGKGSRLTTSLLKGTGESGDIKIETKSFSISNRASLFTATAGKGNAGNITVITDNFRIADNASVNATTLNDGNAGNITFYANTFEATNGGRIVTATDSSGNAGTITLNIKDKIILSGSEQSFTGLEAATSRNSTGKGGSIIIDPRLVIIENGAKVSVGSDGKGDAGDIFLQAENLQLNKGFITAQTASTQGGDINLQISELLLLRNNSQISTTAGTAEAGGDGGNIDINSKFIVAIPKEDSNISANAFTGSGGKVNITSQGIFGIESRSQPTDKSDITASSKRGISGETNINQDDTSSIQNSFTELSPSIDTDAIIANSCIVRGNKRQENSFTITGSGALRSDRAGNVFVSKYTTGKVRNVEIKNQSWKKGDAIVEPSGLYRLSSGELLLSRECN